MGLQVILQKQWVDDNGTKHPANSKLWVPRKVAAELKEGGYLDKPAPKKVSANKEKK